MIRTEIGRITQGRDYQFHELRAVKRGDLGPYIEDVIGCRYRVLSFAQHGVTRQEQVIYQGLEKPDLDRLFVCSMNDFAVHFRPAPEPATALETPQSPEKATISALGTDQPTGDAWHATAGQTMANQYGEAVLVLPEGRTQTDAAGSIGLASSSCLILASVATEQERWQAMRRFEPEETS